MDEIWYIVFPATENGGIKSNQILNENGTYHQKYSRRKMLWDFHFPSFF